MQRVIMYLLAIAYLLFGVPYPSIAGLVWEIPDIPSKISENAVGGMWGVDETGQPRRFYICRGDHEGSTHSGKTWAGYDKCKIGWHGNEELLSQYEILVKTEFDTFYFWQESTSRGDIPGGSSIGFYAVAGGYEDGQYVYICRGWHNGGYHPGETREGGTHCHIGDRGKEVQATYYHILMTPGRKVFVSSATYTGDLGGTEGADTKCQMLAEAVGLEGRYMSWTSDSESSPMQRFTKSAASYRCIDGPRVAVNWDDLIDGDIENPIIVDEKGEEITNLFFVWTATGTNGMLTGDAHCWDWSSVDAVDGGIGIAMDGYQKHWTEANYAPCGSAYRLYCFEQ